MLTYDRAQFNNATVTEPEKGHLHIVTSKAPSSEDITKYSETRITRLVFRTEDVSETTAANLALSNGASYGANGNVLENVKLTLENASVNICAKNAMDKNRDGMIGIGDVALADASEKADIAAVFEIHPYKRAIAVTIDGAGRAWSDNAVYNGKGITSSGAKIEGEGLENVRNNPYCINLFNNEMAVSDSAISMNPPISAQNYCSILHGVNFTNLSSGYQFTNDIAGASQWPDYVLSTPKYPSFLRAVNQNDPSRKMYAYAEWSPITNGVLEQNSGAYVDYMSGSYCFDCIADYIKAGNMKDTTVAYMQSDVMDHYGHNSGYFTDGYYELLGEYETFFPTMINALKEQGIYDDTLLIVNGDHGGHNYWHGTNNKMQARVSLRALRISALSLKLL